MDTKAAPIKAQTINSNATENAKVQAYKKAVLKKAKKEIDKIEEEIKQLEQDKI